MTSDREIVQRCLGGDPLAYEELVRRYQDRALRTAVGLLGDADLAHDAVQEAFIRCFRNLSRLEDQVSFGTWLYQAVVWAARTQGRSLRRWIRLLLMLDAGRPETAFTESDQRTALLAALRQLPRRQREVIVLRYYLDLSETETARLLRCPPGTVKSRTAAAFERLRLIPGLSGLLVDSDTGGMSSVRP